MSSVWGIIFIVVLLLIWIIAGGYITQANVYLGEFKNNDNLFKQAYDYTFWGAFITWTLVGIFILIIILAIFGVVALFGSGAGEAEVAAGEVKEEESIYSKVYKQYQQNNQPKAADQEGISWLTIIFLFVALVLLSVTGILAAISAEDLTKSHFFDENNNNIKVAYDNCVIAAVLCLTSVGLIVLGLIGYLFVSFFFERQKNAVVAPTAPVSAVIPAVASPIVTLTPTAAIPIATPIASVKDNITNIPKITLV